MQPLATPITAARARSLGGIEGLLLVGALAGLHVDVSFRLDLGSVPNVIAAPFGLLLFVANLPTIARATVSWLVGLTTLYVVSAVYAVGLKGAQPDAVAAVGLMLYSLVIGLGIYFAMLKLTMKQIRRSAWFVVILLLVIALLEVATPLRQLAIAFSAIYGTEADLNRDVIVYGGYRPRVLTSEPSHAAISFALAMGAWVFTLRRWTWVELSKAGAVTLVALVLIRSPFVILPAMMVGVRLLLWPETNRRETRGQLAGRLAALLVGSIAALSLAGAVLGIVFADRISSFDPRSDWSVTVRTYGALLASWSAATTHWLFGTGIANFEAARFELAYTYRQLGVPSYVTETDLLEVSINNAPSVLLIFFGFVGSIVYLFIWGGLLRSLAPGAPRTVIWSLVVIVGLAYSAIYSPGLVSTTFLLMAVLAIAARERAGGVPTGPRQAQGQPLPWERRQFIARPLATPQIDTIHHRPGV